MKGFIYMNGAMVINIKSSEAKHKMRTLEVVAALMMLMANPSTQTKVAEGITWLPAEDTLKTSGSSAFVDRHGSVHFMDSAAFKGLIKAVIALYVIAILVQAVVPGTITTFSNTTAITGYSTWSSSVTSAWGSLPSVVIVVVVVIFIAIVVAVINLL
jgi:hypothetical protein